MPSPALRLAMVWHQHQPYYRENGSYLLPWARLHATKDYYDIAAALRGHPTLRQTINVVPSLLDQLDDYATSDATDRVLDLTQRSVADLSQLDKVEILRNFFLCNAPRMIAPYTRYAELYKRRGENRDDTARLENVAETFSTQDWIDLQVWYMLTWIGEYSREGEPFASLLARGGGFSEHDRDELVNAARSIVASVIPTYRTLYESGQVELTVTPYYHPILPILCDSFVALEATPNANLPNAHIAWPEDAADQITEAIGAFERRFGRRPNGMWPSEGGVSDQTLGLIRSAGFTWSASDELVLRRTLGEEWTPLSKYFPWQFKTRSGPLWMVFRDHDLSDAIGFVYSSWDAKAAALDFYNRLIEIRTRILQELGPSGVKEALVSVILDGENCWEYYEKNGKLFLEELYTLLDASTEIETTTVSAALESTPERQHRTRGRIYAGSWIGGNFRIWIGHEEDNDAWDALAEARRVLLGAKETIGPERFAEAMREVHISEGSDWFWWYGDENSAENQDDFDSLFRHHIRRVYEIIGQSVPERLDQPFRRHGRTSRVVPPRNSISPTVDGLRSSDNEWSNAGYIVIGAVGGAMHSADVGAERIYFGADAERLYVQIDVERPADEGDRVVVIAEGDRSVTLHFVATGVAAEVGADKQGRIVLHGIQAAISEVLEASIPLDLLFDNTNVPRDEVGMAYEIHRNGRQVDRFPHQGTVQCRITGE